MPRKYIMDISTRDTLELARMLKEADRVASNLNMISGLVDIEEIEVAELKMKIAKRMLREYITHGNNVLREQRLSQIKKQTPERPFAKKHKSSFAGQRVHMTLH